MYLFSFDAETDGLYGPVWAIGAVVLDAAGNEVNSFAGQVSGGTLNDPWVIENVVPFVNLPRYATRRELRDAFWSFWMEYRGSSITLADFGSPVESGLFRSLIADDPTSRQWHGPYPLHEVGTMLLAAGLDPDLDRIQFTGLTSAVKHDPVWDARVSAAAWRKAAAAIME